jgi:hypothetical protein
MALESESPGDMDMLLVGKPLDSWQQELPARFLPVQDKPNKGVAVKSDDKGKPGILFSHVEFLPQETLDRLETERDQRRSQPGVRPRPLDLAEEAARQAQRLSFAAKANELEIQTRKGRSVILETGSMGDAIKAFDQCSRDSLRDWGVDPDLEDKVVRPVWLENHDTFIQSEDYPKAMLFAGQQSEVKVRVLVDAGGHVTKCTPLSHFKLPEFTKLVCDRVTQRAKFAPAELSDGTKVPSYYTVHIRFRIAA